jgi:hypothetical protein
VKRTAELPKHFSHPLRGLIIFLHSNPSTKVLGYFQPSASPTLVRTAMSTCLLRLMVTGAEPSLTVGLLHRLTSLTVGLLHRLT